jgi:glycosyltransferase involved in cell wall biosynthesis
MSVGLPVVACKAAGRHVVGESCGILVEPDAASFAAATLKLLETGAPRARIQRRYRRFRLEGLVGAYESVYRDVLRRKQLN